MTEEFTSSWLQVYITSFIVFRSLQHLFHNTIHCGSSFKSSFFKNCWHDWLDEDMVSCSMKSGFFQRNWCVSRSCNKNTKSLTQGYKYKVEVTPLHASCANLVSACGPAHQHLSYETYSPLEFQPLASDRGQLHNFPLHIHKETHTKLDIKFASVLWGKCNKYGVSEWERYN